MTAKALIKQSQLLRMAKIAKEHGVCVEYEQDGVKIRVYADAQETTRENQIDKIMRGAEPRRSEPRPPEPILPRLDWREEDAMKYLVGLGAEQKVYWRTLKNFGPHTQEKLQNRGYIDVSFEPGKGERLDEVWLTSAGLKAWKAREKYRQTYICL